uniref:NBS-LRR type resistance protein n=1 Tax=Cucumis melo TaxID=3656 RepID=A0A9I9E7V9_CUCME
MEILMGLMEERDVAAPPFFASHRRRPFVTYHPSRSPPSRADLPVLEPSACSGPCTYFVRAQALQPRPRPIRVVPAWVSFRITTYLGLRSPTRPPVWHGYRYDSSDSTGSSQPDCLSASSGFATDQYVLGAPSGQRRPDSVPTGAHVARVRERASRGRDTGKGKLAGDQKVNNTVVYHLPRSGSTDPCRCSSPDL